MKSIRTILLILACCSSGFTLADEIPIEIFNKYERLNGIPKNLLYAIALQEAGRGVSGRFVVWPWSLNIGGKSFYFDTKEQAYARARQELDNGRVYQLGVGVAQHEWRYQKGRFKDLQEALDPERNIEEQAKVLSEFYQRCGSWVGAIALYHVGNVNDRERTRWALKYVFSVMKRHEKIIDY